MKYDNITRATFIKRPNRFIAEVDIDGHKETVHVKNTSRCRGAVPDLSYEAGRIGDKLQLKQLCSRYEKGKIVISAGLFGHSGDSEVENYEHQRKDK